MSSKFKSSLNLLVPTNEPIISIPSKTVLTIGKSIVPEGRPTATTLPAALTESTALLKATFETAVTTAIWKWPPFESSLFF